MKRPRVGLLTVACVVVLSFPYYVHAFIPFGYESSLTARLAASSKPAVADDDGRRAQRPLSSVAGRFGLGAHRPVTTLQASSSTHNNNNEHRPDDQDYDYYLATCIPGLSSILADELTELNCRQVEITGPSAVKFVADISTALSTVIWCRTAHKILQKIADTAGEPVYDRDSLYEFVQAVVDLPQILGNGRGGLLTLAVSVVLNNARCIPTDLNHSHYTALTIKNALCDAVRSIRPDGQRPNVDTTDPDVPLVAVIWGEQRQNTAGQAAADADAAAHVSLYRQLHTGSLHRRGYRQHAAMHKAAMKESMAAGLLLYAADFWPAATAACRQQQQQPDGHDHPIVLVDPMAGSGSLVLEAAMMAADLAPGLMRIRCGVQGASNPPMVRWKSQGDSDDQTTTLWRQHLTRATQRAKVGLRAMSSSSDNETTLIQIHANDIHPGALDILEHSLETAGLRHLVQVHQHDCGDWNPSNITTNNTPWTVVTNPPWGARLDADMHEAWEALRVFVRTQCPAGSHVWVLSGNPAATKHLGLRKSQSLVIKTGQQDLRWIQYIWRGSNSSGDADDHTKSRHRKREERPRTTPPIEREERRSPKQQSKRRRSNNNKAAAADQRRKTEPVENEWLI